MSDPKKDISESDISALDGDWDEIWKVEEPEQMKAVLFVLPNALALTFQISPKILEIIVQFGKRRRRKR